MTDALAPTDPDKRFLSDSGIALIVYILYLIGFLTGITALLGVIVAHLYWRSASQQVATHLQFQVRTFWFGVVYFVLGCLLWYFVIGIFILLWWGVWTLIRAIRGMLLLNDGKSIPDPKSLLFGGTDDPSKVISPTDVTYGVATNPKQSEGRSMLVLLVVAGVISVLALELGLVEPFWRGFFDGLTGTN
jgi:uncharacterized membrane protein